MQFKAMVESNSLYEWSSEVALGLSSKFCNWVVEEEPQAEDDITVVGDQRSILGFSHINPKQSLVLDNQNNKLISSHNSGNFNPQNTL